MFPSRSYEVFHPLTEDPGLGDSTQHRCELTELGYKQAVQCSMISALFGVEGGDGLARCNKILFGAGDAGGIV
jgi:hypothetical protein